MAVAKPTLPDDMTTGDMALLTTQVKTIDVDQLYIGTGSYASADISTKFADKTVLATELSTNLEKLGLLAEKAFKPDSKVEKVKTKHYSFETKRTNIFEATINGISQDKKTFLEGISRDGTQVTMVAVNKALSQALIVNGLTWSVAWSGEDGGLWSMVLTAEHNGTTEDIFIIKHNIPDAA